MPDIAEKKKVLITVTLPLLTVILLWLLALFAEAGYSNEIDLQVHDTYYVFRIIELIGVFSGIWILVLRKLNLYPSSKWLSAVFGLLYIILSVFLLIQINATLYIQQMLKSESYIMGLIFFFSGVLIFFLYMAGMMLYRLLPDTRSF